MGGSEILRELIDDMEHALDDVVQTGIAHGEEDDFGIPPDCHERVRHAMDSWEWGVTQLELAIGKLTKVADEMDNHA